MAVHPYHRRMGRGMGVTEAYLFGDFYEVFMVCDTWCVDEAIIYLVEMAQGISELWV